MRRHTLKKANGQLTATDCLRASTSLNTKFLLKTTTGAFSVFAARTFSAMGCFGPGQTEQEREEHKRQKHNSKEIEKQLKKDKLTFRATHRLLLLGNILNILRCCFIDLTSWLWLGLSISIYISSFFLLRCWRIGQEYNRKTDANPSCQWLRRTVSRTFLLDFTSLCRAIGRYNGEILSLIAAL